MAKRPTYRTPVNVHPGTDNGHILRRVRTPWTDFSPESGRLQCKAVARSTGERCKIAAIQGRECCRMHGGMRYLDKLVRQQGGPRIAEKARVCRPIARQYDVACSFALADLEAKLSKTERREFRQLSLSARGRKLQEVARRELAR